MRTRTVTSTLCFRRGRLDSNYYLAPGVAARDRLAQAEAEGLPLQPIAVQRSVGDVWQPKRFKRAYAAPGEASVPYLRPYDVFECLPTPAGWLSSDRTENLDQYEIRPGTILQTCSGRNLGPVTVADRYLSGFVLSHDMLRIEVEDDHERAALLAFLSSPTGQAILRQRMSGSVVDHLTADDVGALVVPQLSSSALADLAEPALKSAVLVEEARFELAGVLQAMRRRFPPPPPRPKRYGWTVSSSYLQRGRRMDAHYHDPEVEAARQQLQDAGGVRLGELAQAFLPARYKRYYVGPEYGRPIMSGRQLLQIDPINLRYISDRSFNDPETMILQAGMVAFGAVGRWEGRLGEPALITADREGWLASNDVMRLSPRPDVDPGWLWLAVACEPVQTQIAALPYGSVIDHTGPEDVENEVIVPPPDAELGRRAREAWWRFDQARAAKRKATNLVERLMESAGSIAPEWRTSLDGEPDNLARLEAWTRSRGRRQPHA